MTEIIKTNLNFNGLEIDITNRLVRKQRKEIDLTFIEFEVFYLSANSLGRVFSKEQIYDRIPTHCRCANVWGFFYFKYEIVKKHNIE